MFYVYILFSESKNRFYIGQTNNIEGRIERHNEGLVKSTKSGAPWKIIKVYTVGSRSEAILLESRIKKRGAARFLEDENKV